MKIGVLANCQAHGFTESLALICPEAELISVSIADVRPDQDLEALAAGLRDVDILVRQDVLDKKYGPLRNSALGGRHTQEFPFPAIAFSGFHPDIVYLNHDNKTLAGPMGPYHSALVFGAYLENLPLDRTLRLFNTYVFSRLGYLDAFESGHRFLQKVGMNTGYDFEFLFSSPPHCFMHTINHPKIDVLYGLAQQFAHRAGLLTKASLLPHDRLASHPVWPVYPEIGGSLGVEGTYEFVNGSTRLNLPDFIARSYEVYQSLESIEVPAHVERVRAFIEVEILGKAVKQSLSVEDVRLAFQLILGRDCENLEVASQHMVHGKTLTGVRDMLMRSKEFENIARRRVEAP